MHRKRFFFAIESKRMQTNHSSTKSSKCNKQISIEISLNMWNFITIIFFAFIQVHKWFNCTNRLFFYFNYCVRGFFRFLFSQTRTLLKIYWFGEKKAEPSNRYACSIWTELNGGRIDCAFGRFARLLSWLRQN